MKKKLLSILSLGLLATLAVGCTPKKNKSSADSSTSSSEPVEPCELDKLIKAFVSDLTVTVPSLESYDMDYEMYYWYQYSGYQIDAFCEATGNEDVEFAKLITSSTGFVSYNDEDYTIEEYGYMFVDNVSSPKVELDFYITEKNEFYVGVFRWDGKWGSADVSDIDKSWYVDYVRQYGFEVGAQFPLADIQEFLEIQTVIPGPTATQFVYGFAEAGYDEEGSYAPDTAYVLLEGDVCKNYQTTLNGNGFDIKEEVTQGLDDDWEIIEIYSYSGYDDNHQVCMSFQASDGITTIQINRFSDLYTDQLTDNTDWTSEEKEMMTTYLGEVLPFVKLGKGYQITTGTSYGYTYLAIYDNYYSDLLDSYSDLLDGFDYDADTGAYTKDNKVKALELYLSFSGGNQILAYYEASSYIAATSITLDVEELDCVAGAVYELDVTLEPSDATSTYEFTVNNDVASVSDEGVVTISSSAEPGSSAVVTVTTEDGVTDSATFNVVANTITGFVLDTNELKIAPNGEKSVSVEYFLPYGVDGSAEVLTASSSDTTNKITAAVNEQTVAVSVADDATLGATATVTVALQSNSSIKEEVAVTVIAPSVSETLTAATFGATGTNYKDYDASGVKGVYHAFCAGGNNSIQLRTDKSTSGLIGHFEGKTIESITITFDEHTSAGREVYIYGSNTAFEITAGMYGNNPTATKVGSVSYDGTLATVSFTFEESYSYVGIRSGKNALYIASIEFVWAN